MESRERDRRRLLVLSVVAIISPIWPGKKF